MPILSKSECSKYTDSIVVVVYADAIRVFSVSKTNNNISLLASVVENREISEMNEENIRFNCQKALQMLPQSHLVKDKPLIFVLDPSLSHCSFISVDAKRTRKDSAISDVEINAITSKYYGKEEISNIVFRNFPIDYFVDEFKVPQPLFLNGENITSRMITVSFPKELENIFIEIASTHSLHYVGAIDMCQLFSDIPFFTQANDNIIISIFRNSTTIILIRNNHCDAIGKISVGYGILEQELATALSVGLHEVSTILDVWKNQKIDDITRREIEKIVKEHEDLLKEKIQSSLSTLDPDKILPNLLYIIQPGSFIPTSKNLAKSTDWLKDIPIARNIQLQFIDINEWGISNNSLSKDKEEQKNDISLISALLK